MTAPEPPPSARTAVAVWYVVAVFLPLGACYLWLRRAGWLSTAPDSPPPTDRVVQYTIGAVVLAIGYAVLARLLQRRTGWARWALTALAAVHVLWIVLTTSAGPNVVLLGLIGTGLAVTWQRGTAEWVAQH
ncbi:hypothetical protein [Actinosynnema sp. NPDC023587]|uniref:hypothetical protein n=1 Tax=Actinosynnema sp. NPDC023587 TaxID=3154695 RepID=UPI003408BCFF